MSQSQKNRRQTVHPSRIAQFYSLNQCPAYLAHEYGGVMDEGEIDDVPVSPLLETAGASHERSQLKAVLDANVEAVGPRDHRLAERFDRTWSGTVNSDVDTVSALVEDVADDSDRGPIVLHEAPISETIGAWPVEGRADVVFLIPTDRGARIHIVEIKSASETYTHHKLQVAAYALGFKQQFEDRHDVFVSASVTNSEQTLASVVTAKAGIDIEVLPRVDLRPHENDIKLLLEKGGPVDNTLPAGDDLPPHQLNTSCEGCPHQSKCLGHDIVNQDLALLQLPESTQRTLEEHGVTTVSEVASLYKIPTDSSKRTPVNYNTLQPAKPELVERIQNETDRSDLAELAQIAHRFRRELEPAFDRDRRQNADEGPWPLSLVGSGTNFPDDDPNDENWDGEWDRYPKRSLVRVYPTVVHDEVRNRIVYLGAAVTSSRYEDAGNDPVKVVARPKELPQREKDKDAEERRLLETFFKDLSDAVSTVAPDLSDEDSNCSNGDGYIHLYFWSERHRDALTDATKRHPDATASTPLRKLLGLRPEIDQETVSVLTAEFRNRHALRYPGLGIVQTVAQFYTGEPLDWNDNWNRDDYDIKEVFDEGLFRMAVPVESLGGNRILPQFDDGYVIPDDRLEDDVYPVLWRHRDTVPLEYIWASQEFDALRPENADDRETRERIQRYRHYDGPETPRITLSDIDRLVEALCNATMYVERAIHFKDESVPKEPLAVGALESEEFAETALQRACIEYQQLDHGAKKDAIVETYRRPLQQRIADGDAVAFECSRTPAEGEATIRGDIITNIGRGSFGTGPLSISPGDWVVITPLEENDGQLTETPDKPSYYGNSTLAVVERINHDTVSLFSIWDEGDWPHSTDPSMTWHYGWTSSEQEAKEAEHFRSQAGRRYDKTLIRRGTKFVVDTAIDEYTAYRSRKALEHATENVIHNRLEAVYEKEETDALQQTVCPEEPVEEFLELFDEVMPDDINEEQRSFVRQVDHTITALQGPPGTGKTSMASTPAMLSRAFAQGSGFNGLCTAHSNTAVDELVSDAAEGLRRLQNEGHLSDIELIRVRSAATYHKTPPNVSDIHYREEEEKLLELFNETMSSESSVIIFATPVTLRNALNKVVQSESENHDTVEEMMAEGKSKLFDAALVDEASMMDLPVLFLAGAFIRDDGQLMLVGDHRQMQPIQAHDWETEDRQPIEEHTPALSVLDFIRFARGDVGAELDYLERDPPEWPNSDAVLPMVQLTVTYRLPQSVAELETDLFYSRDNIGLESGIDNPPTIPDVRSNVDTEWLRAALDPDPRVTLLIHDENRARQESPFEAELTRRVVDALPTASPADRQVGQSISSGVVVPFRRQRRRLRQELAQHVQVDTVEKFQGGERDLIILSMTAGNQGYVNTLAEFLLDPNRFNVGASRMRQKLVIVASKALFRAGSTDASEYADQKSWKLLYNRLVRNEASDAKITFTDADFPGIDGQSVTLAVYSGFRDRGNN
ncbi:DEAD/DEAH box helicase [Halobacteriaceae archaeon SHR40]|uniref:AAA domain-containing protein n=1 Tax=Halovenus amylolytica TaxID=2500550 RepID=UPI000FE37692